MSRIVFDNARPVVESDPARTDVACFVGLARATGTALPAAIQDWLQTHGWTDGPLARSTDPPFTDIPIPIESYATFTSLFDPGGSASSYGTDYLAAAVRSFFAQGGRRCYVVRMGDPVSPGDDAVAQNGLSGKAAKLAELMPGYLYAPDDRRSWHGVGHLGGLPDVSFLALPDLPALSLRLRRPRTGATVWSRPVAAQFVECAPPGTRRRADTAVRAAGAAADARRLRQRWAPSVQTRFSPTCAKTISAKFSSWRPFRCRRIWMRPRPRKIPSSADARAGYPRCDRQIRCPRIFPAAPMPTRPPIRDCPLLSCS